MRAWVAAACMTLMAAALAVPALGADQPATGGRPATAAPGQKITLEQIKQAEAQFGANDPRVAQLMYQYAYALYDEGDYQGAEPYLNQALAIQQRTLAPGNPDMVTTLTTLGQLHREAGNTGKAISFFEKALSFLGGVASIAYPQVGEIVNVLGDLHQAAGNHDAAVTLTEQAVSGIETALGPNHPRMIDALLDLGEAYRFKGNHSARAAALERAATVMSQSMEADHPQIASTLLEIARSYRDGGHNGAAASAYERAIAGLEASMEPNHPKLVAAFNEMALVLTDRGQLNAADTCLTRALTIVEGQVTAQLPAWANQHLDLGKLNLSIMHYADAELNFEKRLNILGLFTDRWSSEYANTLFLLGQAEEQQGKYGEAEAHYQGALTIQERLFGNNSANLVPALKKIAGVYRATGRTAEAAALEQRAGAITSIIDAAIPAPVAVPVPAPAP